MKVYERLPHWHACAQPVFVTWCLAGSLPSGRGFTSEVLTSGQAFVTLDRILDEARAGNRFLAQPDIAQIVIDSLHELSSGNELHSYVIMPNHVHILITPVAPLDEILRRVKGRTARFANVALGRSGTFWQQESSDHLVRNRDEFGRIVNYIENNPVRAGLAASPGAYCYSSAERD